MAPLFPLVVVVLLLLSSSCFSSDEQADELSYMVVPTSSLKHISDGAVCFGHKVIPSANHTWSPLNRPHGPCSPINGTPAVMVEDMLLSDQRRASYIRAELSNGADGERGIDDHSGGGVATDVDYSLLTTADLGSLQQGSRTSLNSDLAAAGNSNSGGVSQTVVIDTSSDIPWVQCLPCPSPQCHLQKDVLYDPSRSSTYAPISCGSPACAQLGASYGNGCSRSQQCQYTVSYGDGRATTGTYVTDRLTLGPNIVVPNLRFGCSHAVRGFFSDQTAGTLALGGGSQSLLAQTARTFGNAFSYCVPSPSTSGFLSMGGPIAASSLFARTPLIRNPRNPTFYIVRLQAITVAGQRLNVPPAVFSAGSVMDSSMIITRLPPTAYRALRSAFRNAMRMYPLTAPRTDLDTCYDFLRFPTVRVPKISLVFDGGAVVQLDRTAVMLDGCLAFAANPSDSAVGFIGNVQQQTYEVLYDVGGRSVGFSSGAC
ncbi:unnamed protein product [Urochloa decumbens]|uniref:Peptidase A1 domain-containing protein n=1 Tax=Urochloa decumbens TaxID=240449 RepID=A0ABC9H0F7_9POAL